MLNFDKKQRFLRILGYEGLYQFYQEFRNKKYCLY